jgi:hypothetical protein
MEIKNLANSYHNFHGTLLEARPALREMQALSTGHRLAGLSGLSPDGTTARISRTSLFFMPT